MKTKVKKRGTNRTVLYVGVTDARLNPTMVLKKTDPSDWNTSKVDAIKAFQKTWSKTPKNVARVIVTTYTS